MEKREEEGFSTASLYYWSRLHEAFIVMTWLSDVQQNKRQWSNESRHHVIKRLKPFIIPKKVLVTREIYFSAQQRMLTK